MLRFVLVLALVQAALSAEQIESQIVGGNEAFRGQFRHVVSFRYFPLNNHGCSGSILNSRWVLTAAHCIANSPPFEMVMGTNELSDFGARFQPEEIIVHPSFRTILNPLSTNDIGLVKTIYIIEFNELMQPAQISRDFITRGQAIVAGFGATDMFPGDPQAPSGDPNAVEMSYTLQWIQLNVITNLNCNLRIALRLINGDIPLITTGTQLCTYNFASQGVCYGDSGSGLLVNNEVIGVVSRGILPCARGYPDIFTRVSEYADWIESYINQ